MSDPLSGLPRRSFETSARHDGQAWVADVDGVPISAPSQADLQRQVRAEVIAQTGNDSILVLVHFL